MGKDTVRAVVFSVPSVPPGVLAMLLSPMVKEGWRFVTREGQQKRRDVLLRRGNTVVQFYIPNGVPSHMQSLFSPTMEQANCLYKLNTMGVIVVERSGK